MMARPNSRPISKNEPIDDALDDRAHLVDLPAIARDHVHQHLVGALGIVVAGRRRRQGVDRGRQVGEKAPRAGERLLFGIGCVVDRAAAGLDLPAAQFLLAELLASRATTGGPATNIAEDLVMME